MKKILFLCGSPRGKKSASLSTALYMSRFLGYEYEFVDVVKSRNTGSALDTGQIQQVIEKNILPVTADNNGRNGGLKT